MLLRLLVLFLALAPLTQAQARLRGHIFDREGRLVIEGWRVELVVAQGKDKPYKELADLDPQSGGFLFEEAPAGQARVRAMDPSGRAAAEGRLRLVKGQDRYLALEWKKPGPERRLAVRLLASAGAPEYPMAKSVRLIDSEGNRFRPSGNQQQKTNYLAFADLDPGPYELRISDPRWSNEAYPFLYPGNCHDIPLKGAATVKLNLISQDGRPVGLCRVTLVQNVNGRPSVRPITNLGRVRRNQVLVSGLMPGDYTLLVRPGNAKVDAVIAVRGLAERETRTIMVPWPKATEARELRLASDQGDRWPGIQVHLELQNRAFLVAPSKPGKPGPKAKLNLRADEQGQIELPPLTPGHWKITASLGPMLIVTETIPILSGSAEPLWVPVPAPQTLRGKVTLPAGMPTGNLRLVLECDGTDSSTKRLQKQIIWPVRLDAQGRFEIPNLPKESLRVGIQQPQGEQGATFGRMLRITPGKNPGQELILDQAGGGANQLRVVVRIDGEPAQGQVQLFNRRGGKTPYASYALDAKGSTGMQGLQGPYWLASELRFTNRAGTWRYSEDLKLQAPGPTKVQFTLRTKQAKLRVVDADGKPMPGVHVLADSEISGLPPLGAATNAKGELDMRFPKGQLRIELPGLPGDQVYWFEGPRRPRQIMQLKARADR